MENKIFINNLETSKIELHFTKEEYVTLTAAEKQELKSAFLFSKYGSCWVSRSKNNHYSALRVAKKLGFTAEEKQGNKLSYAEELEVKRQKAENRIEKYEIYADNADKRRENLQAEFNEKRKDWSFVTQPNVDTSGGRSFTNYKNKIMARYEKGFEEYRKSVYFREKAQTAANTAEQKQLQSRSYLDNRINECIKSIKKIEKNIVYYEEILNKKESNEEVGRFYDTKTLAEVEGYIQESLEKIEYNMDKQAFFENCLEALGGIKFSKGDIKKGYFVKIKRDWEEVTKVNTKTVETCSYGIHLKYSYAEIEDIKIPEGYQEEKTEIKNPYKIGDILVNYSMDGSRVINAFQVLKTTEKGVQLQKINIDNNTPIVDGFTTDKPIRKQITKSKYRDYIGCYVDNRELHKYNIA